MRVTRSQVVFFFFEPCTRCRAVEVEPHSDPTPSLGASTGGYE